jgi:hypothetical protein
VIITTLVPPLDQAMLCSHDKSGEILQNINMPSTFGITMPSSPSALSSHPHIVKETHLTPPSTPVPSLVEDEHDSAQNQTCPDAPRTPRTGPDTTLDAPVRTLAPSRLSLPRFLLSPTHQLAPGQPHWIEEALSPSP